MGEQRGRNIDVFMLLIYIYRTTEGRRGTQEAQPRSPTYYRIRAGLLLAVSCKLLELTTIVIPIWF